MCHKNRLILRSYTHVFLWVVGEVTFTDIDLYTVSYWWKLNGCYKVVSILYYELVKYKMCTLYVMLWYIQKTVIA